MDTQQVNEMQELVRWCEAHRAEMLHGEMTLTAAVLQYRASRPGGVSTISAETIETTMAEVVGVPRHNRITSPE